MPILIIKKGSVVQVLRFGAGASPPLVVVQGPTEQWRGMGWGAVTARGWAYVALPPALLDAAFLMQILHLLSLCFVNLARHEVYKQRFGSPALDSVIHLAASRDPAVQSNGVSASSLF